MFRTDANNNPTAMTTDVAIDGSLILNADYVQGDQFEAGGRIYHTARLIGDPVAVTIKCIDKAGFFNSGGQQRWSYVGIPYFMWEALDRDEKIRVIGGMYKREAGIAMKHLFPAVTW